MFNDCTFRGNRAGDENEGGAAVSVSTGGFGGAVYLESGGNVHMHGTLFEDNVAVSGGGGTCSGPRLRLDVTARSHTCMAGHAMYLCVHVCVWPRPAIRERLQPFSHPTTT